MATFIDDIQADLPGLNELLKELNLSPIDEANDEELIDYYASISCEGEFVDPLGGHYSADRKVFIRLDAAACVVDTYTIADGTEIILSHSFGEDVKLAKVIVPSSVRKICAGINMGSIEEIDMRSMQFHCLGGFILDADGRNLIGHYGNYEKYLIPKCVYRVRSTAMCGCTAKGIYALNNVAIVEEYAFAHCPNLQFVKFGGVSYIGDFALAYCPNLKKVGLNSYIIKIGKGAFAYSPNLENVQFEGEDGEYRSSCDSHYTISDGLGTKYLVEYPVILVTILGNPDSCELPKVLGEITSDGSDNSQVVTLQGIGAYAFAGRTNIKSISLPKSVETIHEKAFEGTNAIIERNE